MQNLFVQDNEEFTIKFSVATDKEGSLYCDIDKASLEETIQNIKEMEICDYKAIFKRPSFGEITELYEKIFSLNDSSLEFNPLLARYNKIVSLIKRWDIKEGEAKPTEEDIRSLHPIIATVIGIQLEAEIGPILG